MSVIIDELQATIDPEPQERAARRRDERDERRLSPEAERERLREQLAELARRQARLRAD